VIGALGGGAGPVPLVHVLMRQLRMQGVFVGSRRAFERLVKTIEAHAIKPIVGATYSLRELPEALERLKSGSHIGKIALRAET
jgi:D-arabinose 1-dehydrogenase-like Zn-dependent alcohol dehydrogenase